MRFIAGLALLWKRQSLYYIVGGVFMIVLLVACLALERGWMVTWFSENRSPFGDAFFEYATYLGDGLFAVGVILIAGLVRARNWIVIGLGTGLAGGLAQFFKRVVFDDVVRPSTWADQMSIPFIPVDGVALNGYFSFPSGHTATAFALFLGLALLRPGHVTGTILVLAAIIVGISRVYLGQHFAEDVVGGAFVGMFSMSLCFALISTMPWYRKRWAGYSLLGIKQGPY